MPRGLLRVAGRLCVPVSAFNALVCLNRLNPAARTFFRMLCAKGDVALEQLVGRYLQLKGAPCGVTRVKRQGHYFPSEALSGLGTPGAVYLARCGSHSVVIDMEHGHVVEPDPEYPHGTIHDGWLATLSHMGLTPPDKIYRVTC